VTELIDQALAKALETLLRNQTELARGQDELSESQQRLAGQASDALQKLADQVADGFSAICGQVEALEAISAFLVSAISESGFEEPLLAQWQLRFSSVESAIEARVPAAGRKLALDMMGRFSLELLRRPTDRAPGQAPLPLLH
jgi:prophage DNA circulation protein